MINKHWQPTLFALALLPATAAAEPNSPTELRPLASSLYIAETAEPLGKAAADDEINPLEFDVFWKDSLNFQTKNKQFKLKIGGRIHHDWAWFSEDIEEASAGALKFQNGAEFRRTRLYLSGSLYKNIVFKMQMDFASDATGADFKDVYVGWKKSKEANFRVGQFNEPISLGMQTSSNYGAFLERAVTTAITADRSTGAMVHGACNDERLTYALGVFKEDNDVGATATSGAHAFTGRVTGLLVDSDNSIVSLGISASSRNLPGSMFDADFRPAAHLAPRLLNNTAFAADDAMVCGAELAVISGPFWASGEYIMNDIDARDGMADATITGHYVQTGYFLTGESRGFKRSKGAFDKLKPKNPFGGEGGGCGAWEVAARYGSVEFENLRSGATLFTDELSDMTFGLNWYLNTNARIMFNYVRFDLESNSIAANTHGTAFQTRFSLFL